MGVYIYMQIYIGMVLNCVISLCYLFNKGI